MPDLAISIRRKLLLLVPLALIVAATWSIGTPVASADGFNPFCEMDPGVSTAQIVADPNGEIPNYTFKATNPAGSDVTPAAYAAGIPNDALTGLPRIGLINLGTGGPLFTQTNILRVDDLGTGSAGTNDANFSVALRASTAAGSDGSSNVRTGSNPLDQAFKENFGAVSDYPVPIGLPQFVGGAGVDLNFSHHPDSLTTDHLFEYGILVDVLDGGERRHLMVNIGFDGRPIPGDPSTSDRRLPEEANLSLFVKPTGGATGLLGLGLETWYQNRDAAGDPVAGALPHEQHPPMGLSVEATFLDEYYQPVPGRHLVSADFSFEHAPGDWVVGMRQECTASAETARAQALLRRLGGPDATDVDVELVAQRGSGLPEIPGGPPGDVFALDASVEDLPEQVDVILHNEGATISHFGAQDPDIVVDRLVMAPDAAHTDFEQPLVVSGRVDGLPEHVRVFAEVDSRFQPRSASLSVNDFACDPAQPVNSPFLPKFPVGCVPDQPASAGLIDITAANFFATDTEAAEWAEEIAPGTTTACTAGRSEDWATFGLRQDVRQTQGGVFRLEACLEGLQRGGFHMPGGFEQNRSKVTADIVRDGGGDVAVTGGVVLADRDDADHFLRIEGRATVENAPAEARFSMQPRFRPLIVDGGVNQDQTIDIELTSDDSVHLDLDRLRVASGPAEAQTTDIYAAGRVEDVPPHIRLATLTRFSASQPPTLQEVEVKLCPDLPAGDPYWFTGGLIQACLDVDESERSSGLIAVTAQNFDPGDPIGSTLPDLTPPTGGDSIDDWATIAYAPSQDPNPARFRADAQLSGGFREASFDTTGTGPTGTRVEAALLLADPGAEALVRAHVDARTSTNEAANTGFRIDGAALVTPLPADLALSFGSVDAPGFFADTIAAIDWHASNPVAVTNPGSRGGLASSANVEIEGPAGLRLAGNLELGRDGGGGIASDGHVAVQSRDQLSTEGEQTRYDVEYSASAPLDIEAGLMVSTAEDRSPAGIADDLRTRVFAKLGLPAVPAAAPISVSWVTRDDTVPFIAADLCGDADPCPGNTIAASVHRGTVLSDDEDLDAPAFPAVGPLGNYQPQPALFPSDADDVRDGLRAVVLEDGTVAADVTTHDISEVWVNLDPMVTVGVNSDRPAGEADEFGLWIYGDMPGVPPAFVQGSLNKMPDDFVARFRADGGSDADDDPWIWVNTESTDISNPPVLSGDDDEAPSDVELQALVMVGDQTPFPTAVQGDLSNFYFTPGAGLRAAITSSGLSLRSRVLLDLPRHVQLWQPDLTNCTSNQLLNLVCPEKENYEPDHQTELELRYASTGESLGELKAYFDIDNGPMDYEGEAFLDSIPGSLDLQASLTQNQRLPWTNVDLSYEASDSPGSLSLQMWDRCLPAYVGDIANSPELAQPIHPGDCISSPSDVNKVPNYDVTLDRIPASLDFVADVWASEAPNDGTPRKHEACRDHDYEGRGPSRLGYLHADLDLRGEATDLSLKARMDRDISSADSDNSDMAVRFVSNAPIDGEMRAKLLNVGQEASVSELKKLEIFGVEVADLIEANVEVCVDLDLPLALSLDDVAGADVRMAGTKLGVDLHDHDLDLDAGRVVGQFGETFECRTNSGPFACGSVGLPVWMDGVPMTENQVSLDVDGTIIPLLNFVENGQKWKNVGIVDLVEWGPPEDPADDCSNDVPADCWRNHTTENEFDTSQLGRQRAFHSEILLDPIWDSDTRGDIDFYCFAWDIVFGCKADVGGGFYRGLDEQAQLPAFIDPPAVSTGEPIHAVVADYEDGTLTSRDNDDAEAVGSDGTIYKVTYPLTGPMFGCLPSSVSLEAWHQSPSGDRTLRWWRNLGPLNRPCDHELRITPHYGGSVDVVFDSTRRQANSDRAARLDASGHGMFLVGREVSTVDLESLFFSSVQLAIPPTGDQPETPAPNATRVWHFEDGTQVVSDEASMVRRIGRTGLHYVLVVDYNTKGEPIEQTAFSINVTTGRPPLPVGGVF
jgi:hypothetical protein